MNCVFRRRYRKRCRSLSCATAQPCVCAVLAVFPRRSAPVWSGQLPDSSWYDRSEFDRASTVYWSIIAIIVRSISRSPGHTRRAEGDEAAPIFGRLFRAQWRAFFSFSSPQRIPDEISRPFFLSTQLTSTLRRTMPSYRSLAVLSFGL